jgi:protein-S-isoprenylcysteine O-methyltransferase Ste14
MSAVPLWLRTAYVTVVLPGTVAAIIPHLLVESSLRAPVSLGTWRWLGIAPLAAGIGIYASTAWFFAVHGRGTPAPWDPPRRLVHSGPYGWVRNPMYLGVLLCVLGQALLRESAGLFAYLVLLFAAFHVRVLVYEEPVLRRTFGAAFSSYTRRVPRWLPRRPAQEFR